MKAAPENLKRLGQIEIFEFPGGGLELRPLELGQGLQTGQSRAAREPLRAGATGEPPQTGAAGVTPAEPGAAAGAASSAPILRTANSATPASAVRTVLAIHGYGGSPRDLLPLALALSQAGLRVVLPLLPGHGPKQARGGAERSSPDLAQEGALLSAKAVSQAAPTWLQHAFGNTPEAQPKLFLGHSLGARLALAWAGAGDRVVAISTPQKVDFTGEARRELMQALRPRWVQEERPMAGLVELLSELPQTSDARVETLFLRGSRDLSCCEWPEGHGLREEIRDCDHASILLHPETERRAAEWLLK